MQSELKQLCANAIALILLSESGQLLAARPDAPTLNHDLANAAAVLSLTGTTTTTISRPMSGGSAVVVTLKSMSPSTVLGEAGSPSRFAYVAKASRADRGKENSHPTVKSLDLMRWLCRLITPKGGTVLDPFMGSGSTGVACIKERFRFVGMEKEEKYYQTAVRRCRRAVANLGLLGDMK